MKRRRRAVQVTIHEEFHRMLIKIADRDGQTIQGTLHLILCKSLLRPDLVEDIRITANVN
jgi:hypothetical protein